MPAGNYGGDGDQSVDAPDGYYYGGHGNDLVGGEAVADELYGGQGNDILIGAQINSYPGPGAGTVGNPFALGVVAIATGNDFLEGGTGSDAVHGFDGDDEIYGGSGDDSGQVASFTSLFWSVDGKPEAGLYGGDGDDYIEGGKGEDALYGGDDDDELHGGADDDLIDGGAGVDNMFGGSGEDTYQFLSLDDLDGDRIGDFSHKEGDIIDVSGIDAKPGGSDNAFKYIGDDAFTKKGQIAFHKGKVLFNTDDDKGAEAVLFLNTDKLSTGDFDL